MKPPTGADAERLARAHYGLCGTATPLPGELDANFALRTEDGRRFVMKLMHAGYQESMLDLQCQVLQHLGDRRGGTSVAMQLPTVVPTREGSSYVEVEAGGGRHWLWLLTWLDGRLLAHYRPHSRPLFTAVGRMLGAMDRALLDFTHPAAARELPWDLARAAWIREHLGALTDVGQRALVRLGLERFEREVAPRLVHLRSSVIHGDANDYNLLVGAFAGEPLPPPAVPPIGLIDFGDLLHTCTVAELAIAAAYVVLDQEAPVRAVAALVAGYHAELPLSELELELLFPLLTMRLCVSVVMAALRRRQGGGNDYHSISEAPAWRALAHLIQLPSRLPHYHFRAACGLPAVPHGAHVVDYVRRQAAAAAPLFAIDCGRRRVLDLSVASDWLGADPAATGTPALTRHIEGELAEHGATVGIGRYGEPRVLYQAPQFGGGAHATGERRTHHLGIDLFVPAGTAVHAPLAGTVRMLAHTDAPLDYGNLVVLEHRTDRGTPFFTLYGHLAGDCHAHLQPGQRLDAGEPLGRIGASDENGGWPPHLHLQLITDLLDETRDYPGVCRAAEFEVWRQLSPDPWPLLRSGDPTPALPPDRTELLAARRRLLGSNLRLSYRSPLCVVRGLGTLLYDERGRAYLDCYNNVAHVGHSHPRVVRAVQRQIALLNTNTRYLHENVLRYAERLAALLPAPLSVCYFLNSASEANEVALRIARAATGHADTIVMAAAYHGHTTGLIEVSPYKFEGPGGAGRRGHVHVVPLACDYRGPYRRPAHDTGSRYAEHVAEVVAGLQSQGRGAATLLCESMPSVGGQIVLPAGYLSAAYAHVRAAGGVCVADEVQVGLGRLGDCFWGFEQQGVVPDVVVLGKPIGNGFPLAAVITTPALAAKFDNGMEFFSTFGGNPVAAAAGLAVLDAIAEEGLQDNARRRGEQLLTGLRQLQQRHALIGDVRGMGLFVGVELVADRDTLEPAAAAADYVVERLRQCGILCGTDGPLHNVLKLRPPLVVSRDDVDLLLERLDAVLGEDPLRPLAR